ncbi:periplasmic heavy metal sensor [uncultured Brevundimonas sp.]|uniref:Spy/CpxP family protein refolding chaperone n=1 Tax=uncultured Brevundimonas sp. TaxID=213418 RepID=UPI0030ECC3E8|tara:strand:- start:782 stop:1222 length:441 start_codon:yes stop_codon:yes gene_type:complete
MIVGWKSIAITAVLAALASGVGTWASANWMMRQHATPSLHTLVHHELDLSADQEARLDAIEARFATQRVPLEAEVRAANDELAHAIEASDGDSPAVRAAVDHFHAAMGDLQKATIAHVFEMRATLTPTQARIFDTRIVDALRQDPG